MHCHHFLQKHCLSCDLLSHTYASSIKLKEQALANLFPAHLDKIKASVLCETGLDGSRNKAKLALALVNDEIEFGFYNKAMQFKKLEDCPLHAAAINQVLPVLKNLIKTHKIMPYDLSSKKGELKYVLLTYSESTNQLLIRFVLRSKESLDRLRKLSCELSAIHPMVKVITANIQALHQAILEGEEEIVLSEEDCIMHRFDEYVLFQGSRSFFQTNTALALRLYKQLQEEISHLSIHSFLDLYCGVGAFSFFASKYCAQVTGVEISPAAIHYANQANKKNGQDIQFLAMDAEVFLKNQASHDYDAIMVNPPRRGLNEEIIKSLLILSPKYLFYSSCNAQTLQRDAILLDQKYELLSLQLFDMFPFTSHFETLAVFIKK